MKGEAEEEEEWVEGGARGLVVGGWSFFRFLLAGAAGEEGPLLVACAVGAAAAADAEGVVEAVVGVEVEVDGALGLRDLRFFLAGSEGVGAGVEKDAAGSGRKGKKLSNIIARRSQQRGACVCGNGVVCKWGEIELVWAKEEQGEGQKKGK